MNYPKILITTNGGLNGIEAELIGKDFWTGGYQVAFYEPVMDADNMPTGRSKRTTIILHEKEFKVIPEYSKLPDGDSGQPA